MSQSFTVNYETARRRAASLAARPFIPRTRLQPPTRQARVAAVVKRCATVFVNVTLAASVIGLLVFVLLLAAAADRHALEIQHACLRQGHVIYKGLCLSPETAQRIILEQERLLK